MPPTNPAAYQNPFGLGMISMPQPQSFNNSFPQETSQQFGPPAPQPNPVAQAGQQALGLYNTYQAANQLGSGIGSMLGTSPAAPAMTPAIQSSAPAFSSGYPMTEAVMQGGDIATAATPYLGGMSPVATSPWYAAPVGSNAAALGSSIEGGLGSLGLAPETAAAWGSGLGTALPVAAGAYGAYGLYNNLSDNVKDWKGGAASGAALGGAIGSFVPVVGTLAGMGLGGLVGGLAGGLIGGDKDADQRARDAVRGSLKGQNYLSPDFMLELQKSGINLDLGKDGGFRYGEGTPGERPVYNLDWENDANVPQAVGWLKPFTLLIANGDEKLASDFTAQFYNELTKDGKATDPATIKARILDLYHKFELKPSVVRSAIEAMNLPQGEKDAAFAAIDNLRPGSTTTQGPDIPKFQTPSIQQPQKPQSTAPDKPLGEAPKPTPQPEKPKSSGGTASALPPRGIGLYGRR